jgi:predicted Rossmann fold flavoprotein
VKAFEILFTKFHTKVLLNQAVTKIEKIAKGFIIHSKNNPPLQVSKVILALGGQAYRHTGSTGDGYTLAESLGHTITTLGPSLHSFIIKEKWPKKLAGVSIKHAGLTAGRTAAQHFTGPFLFTHSGITGPAVFALSSLTAFEDFSVSNPLPISIDFIPDLSTQESIELLKNKTLEHPKKLFKNCMHFFVPASVAEIIMSEYKLPGEKTNGEISKAELEKTASTLKKITLSAVVRGAGDEFVTAGGVELGDVNPKTMESKLCSGLFFAGEILNVDGFTGGFNLQASWATGRAAGEHASAS